MVAVAVVVGVINGQRRQFGDEMTNVYAELQTALDKDFPGYHIEIQFYPSGGIITALGCEECGTRDGAYESAIWKTKKDQSLDSAVERLKRKLEAAREGEG